MTLLALATGLVVALALAGNELGLWQSSPAASEPTQWTKLVEAGDILVASGQPLVTRPDGLTARAAYLLAFHEAQDRGDLHRMLLAANRLERLGEQALARHARHVASYVAASQPSP